MSRANGKKLATNSSRIRSVEPSENCDFSAAPIHVSARQESSLKLPTRLGRLGRTRRSLTTCITPDAALNLYAALVHACHSDLSPDRHLTIDWAKAGVMDSIKATGRLLKLMRDCLAKHDCPIAYVWVREVGAVHGEHVHILLHVSPEQHERVKRNMRGWMKQCGAHLMGSVWRTRIISGVIRNKGANVVDPALYLKNLATLRNYILKHCHPKAAKSLGFTSSGPCELLGKRVSVSQNLSAKSRAGCPMCSSLKSERR